MRKPITNWKCVPGLQSQTFYHIFWYLIFKCVCRSMEIYTKPVLVPWNDPNLICFCWNRPSLANFVSCWPIVHPWFISSLRCCRTPRLAEGTWNFEDQWCWCHQKSYYDHNFRWEADGEVETPIWKHGAQSGEDSWWCPGCGPLWPVAVMPKVLMIRGLLAGSGCAIAASL